MIVTRDELINRLTERIGETPTDADLALLEDVADTVDDFSRRAEGQPDLQARVEELEQQLADQDAEWRRRYTERFKNPTETDDGIVDEEGVETLEYEKPLTYEDLFKVGEE